MNATIHRISLDIHEPHSCVCLYVKREDQNSRIIYISLTEGGFPYHISDECYAVFAATKPDGNIIYNECTIDDDRIIYELTPQTTAMAGDVECEIKLYGTDDALITSPGFTIVVDDTIYDTETEIESKDEFNALTELISKAMKLQKTLPAPPSAEVGQYIVVASVDRNGNVKETIAVDPPRGTTGNAGVLMSGKMLSPGHIVANEAYLSLHTEETEG